MPAIGIAQAQLTVPGSTSSGGNTGPGSRVKGLIGNNNATTPNTQFDLAADEVVLVNPSDGTSIVKFATGTLTNNISTAGSTANGRDQAGAFAAGNFVRFWFIWNGTTLATLASLSATAPTLPSGYTHQAYAGVVLLDGSANLRAVQMFGASAYYSDTTGSFNRILSAGTATTMTAVSASAVIAPECREGIFEFLALVTYAAASVIFMALKTNGVAGTGQNVLFFSVPAAISTASSSQGHCVMDSSQRVAYSINGTPASGGVYIDVIGYVMPNGGE